MRTRKEMVLNSYKPLMKFETKVKLSWHRFYFETGMSLLSYVKYIILFIGLDNVLKSSLNSALLWGVGYGVLCYAIGYLYVKSDFAKAQTEVSNQVNLLSQEIRESLSKNKKL